MSDSTSRVPIGGISIEPRRPLFIVEVEALGDQAFLKRRLFVDLHAAVAFIGDRKARLRALFARGSESTGELFLETVEAALEFEPCNTYLLKFESDSSALWIPGFTADVQLETCDPLYPTFTA